MHIIESQEVNYMNITCSQNMKIRKPDITTILNTFIDWVFNFSGMPTRIGLFYVPTFTNHVHYSFMFIYLFSFFIISSFFLNQNDMKNVFENINIDNIQFFFARNETIPK